VALAVLEQLLIVHGLLQLQQVLEVTTQAEVVLVYFQLVVQFPEQVAPVVVVLVVHLQTQTVVTAQQTRAVAQEEEHAVCQVQLL